MDHKFLNAIEKVLEHEGGYVNHPSDPGGETNFGISKRSYPKLDIKNLTKDDAIKIYYRDWWDNYGYSRIENEVIAGKVFDLAVNMGPVNAQMLIQRAVFQSGGDWLDVDGLLGNVSIGAINRHPNKAYLLDKFRLLAVQYYLNLNKSVFLSGWIKRALD